ncbi:MAG: hypothetical protein WCT08_00265 [Patescibacteria group bacterium]|jgi:hypothetical protein
MVALETKPRESAWQVSRPQSFYLAQGVMFLFVGLFIGLFIGPMLVALTLLNVTAGVSASLSIAVLFGWIFERAMGCYGSTANFSFMDLCTIPGCVGLGISAWIIFLSHATHVYSALAMLLVLPITTWLWSFRYKQS